MNEEKNVGGPAFPCKEDEWYQPQHSNRPPEKVGTVQHNGMTLRDYFAKGAMEGMMSRDTFDEGQATPAQRARLAYIEADAMLKEREL